MSEKEQLTQAKQQLSSSIRATWSDLKNYGKAVVNNTGAIITEARENHRIRQAERAREAEIRERTREHKAGMKAALREQDREARRQRMISFKEGVKQKTSTAFGRLGQIKNNLVERIRPTNLDVKFRNMVDQAQIAGLTAVSKGRDFVVGTKDKVVDFASTQMANHYLRQEERQAERAEQARIREEERAREAEIRERTREHKAGMKAALREQEREARRQRMISFKEGVKQKTSTAFGRLGRMKNEFVSKLQTTKDKVVDFASTQMANYYLRQEERQEEKAFRQAAKLAERAELEQQKARIRERRSAMITALNEQEREQYEQRHVENVARKEELMTSLFGEKQEVEIGHHARAV